MNPRELFRRQALAHWAELALLIFFVAGSLVLVNYIAYRHNPRFDLTPEKRYTLAPQTREVLARLQSPLRATVFYRQQERQEIQDLLDLVSRASDRFAYDILDLEKNPARAEALGIKGYGAGLLEYGGRREKVSYFNEEGLLTAILKLTEGTEKIVRFVKGHGEKEIEGTDPKDSYSTIGQALTTENYRVESLLLLQAERVPDNTSVLVIAGPQKDFLPRELAMIDDYLTSGGRVLMLFDPFPLPAVEEYLAGKHIRLARDFIVDTQSKLMAFDHLTPIVMPDKRHPIARNMNEAVVLPVCRSVVPDERSGVEVLAVTGPESWAERDTQSVHTNSIRFDPAEDLRGPVPVAVIAAVEGKAAGDAMPPKGILVAMGNSSFALNHYAGVLGNKDFFLNTVSWLAEKRGMLSSRLRSGQGAPTMFFLTEMESRLVFWSTVVVEPALVLFLGILVIMWRRFRR